MILRQMALFLVYEKPLDSVDAVVVLSGGDGERVQKAVTLVDQVKTEKVFMTGGPVFNTTYPVLMKQFFLESGGRVNHIVLEENSYSTYDHVVELKPLFELHNVQSFLIVTSKFHTRRSFYVFNAYFESTYDIGIVSADDGVDYDRWWSDSEMIQKIVFEWQKFIWYFFSNKL